MPMRLVTRTLVVLLLASAACSAEEDGASPAPTTIPPTTTAAPAPTVLTVPEGPRPGEGSTFCTSMLRIGGLDPGAEADPAAVVALAQELLDLLGEAQATTPEDAPPAIDHLIDDFRAVALAVGTNGGDVEAAYATLQVEDPEAFARFTESGARDEAYEFLAVHCGTEPPAP
jgi:hypothetical protein